MALTIVKRPQGYVLDTTEVTATVTSSSGALFTKTTHGLSTGDFIYIYSTISSYNGYWYVSVVSGNTFRIREYATASDQAYVVGGSVTYFKSVLTHTWNCVHLPIIYKLKSDIWPTNGADTARTITTFSNYNGYTYIVLSGDIKATGTASALEQVILSGTSVDGTYQILNWFSETNLVIDLPYSGSNVLSSGTAQYYYWNYHARIKIYAGIKSSHALTAFKPYENVVEIKSVPDSSGIITINIAEHIKGKIGVLKNDLLKDTLPNNIDAWCDFYITYAESYDDSNGYTLDEYVSSYTDDSGTFEGKAINAVLPFKTRSSGSMSEYVSGVTSATRQSFMTAFESPVMSDYYFDVSFIKNTISAGDYIKREVYVDDVLKEVYIDTITDYDDGVYRHSITQSGWAEDRIDITLFNSSNVQLSDTLTIEVDSECADQDFYLTWLNNVGGFDYWNFKARKTYSIDAFNNTTQEKNIYTNWPKSYGEFSDTITEQTSRSSRDAVTVASQFISTSQEDAIKQIFSSPLVQLVNSKYDKRTVIVNPATYRIRKDKDDTRSISFEIRYTDNIPSQSL
jgi:hypothetical protein